MDRSRPSDFRSMNPKYCVSQSNNVLSCCFTSILSTVRHGHTYCTIQFDIWSFLGDSSILISCNSVNRHRRLWGSFFVSLILYRKNLLLLSELYRQNLPHFSSTLQTEPAASRCYSRDRTCWFSLLLYRQNLLLLAAILETEPADSLCYFTDRTC